MGGEIYEIQWLCMDFRREGQRFGGERTGKFNFAHFFVVSRIFTVFSSATGSLKRLNVVKTCEAVYATAQKCYKMS